MSGVWPYVAALIPSAGVGFLFWLVIKNMIEGDRKERLAHSQWDAAHPAEDSATPQNGANPHSGNTNGGSGA
ncbi:hypothetical protein [Pedococcus bigeumensis]|uniref:hypothetical protein n=1 Tax=Pedococcus bigeumensis TaxID=433644 RepID=UPI002FEA550D